MIYLRLAAEFLKIGLFAIGGGLASIPFLYDMAEQTGWFTGSDIINMIAISESTPGPLGINMATYVGYTVGGPVGGVIATLCTVIPSLITIIAIAGVLNRYSQNGWVKAAFTGIRPAVTALIVSAFLEVAQVAFIGDGGKSSWMFTAIEWKGVVLFGIMFFLIRHLKKHPIVYLAASAVIGVLFSM